MLNYNSSYCKQFYLAVQNKSLLFYSSAFSTFVRLLDNFIRQKIAN